MVNNSSEIIGKFWNKIFRAWTRKTFYSCMNKLFARTIRMYRGIPGRNNIKVEIYETQKHCSNLVLWPFLNFHRYSFSVLERFRYKYIGKSFTHNGVQQQICMPGVQFSSRNIAICLSERIKWNCVGWSVREHFFN